MTGGKYLTNIDAVVNIKTGVRGCIVLKVADRDNATVRAWYVWLSKKENREAFPVTVDIKKRVKTKSLGQLGLFWALVRVLAYEHTQSFGSEDEYYQGLLWLYAPRKLNPLTKREVPKTLSQMTTTEASGMIEGAFRELALIGVPLEGADQIRKYWQEWYHWRGTQKVDPMDGAYKDLKDYAERVVQCEACLRFLGPGGEMAHIVSAGAGGSGVATWNRLKLCNECHQSSQDSIHKGGWEGFLKQYPHLKYKVEQARERSER
jgi:hypothetical protein